MLVTNYKSVTSKVFNRENSKWFSTKIPVRKHTHKHTNEHTLCSAPFTNTRETKYLIRFSRLTSSLNLALALSHSLALSLSLISSIPAVLLLFVQCTGLDVSRYAFNSTFGYMFWNISTLKPSIYSTTRHTAKAHVQYALIKFHGRVLLYVHLLLAYIFFGFLVLCLAFSLDDVVFDVHQNGPEKIGSNTYYIHSQTKPFCDWLFV